MQFPTRDLTNQYISLSYEDVVQRYQPAGTASYYLDGYGFVQGWLSTTSLGSQLLTVLDTAPFSKTASFSLLSTFADTASLSSYSNYAGSSSFALTASYAATSSFELINEVSSSWASASLSCSYSPVQLPNITDDTNNSKIGINQPSPQYTLDVNGDIGNSGGDVNIKAGPLNDGVWGINLQAANCINIDNPGGTVSIRAGNMTDNLFGFGQAGGDIIIRAGSVISGSGPAGRVRIGGQSDSSGLGFVYLIGNVGINNETPSYTLDVTGDINFTGSLLKNGLPYTASYQQDISVNSITASKISASYITTVDPSSQYQVATKNYVDSFSTFGFHYYFRSASADIGGYKNMYRIDVPLSASATTFVFNNVSSSQYLLSFVSPPLSASRLTYGDIEIRYDAFFNAGGNRACQLQHEIYIRSASVERLIASTTGNAVLGADMTYFDIAYISQSINTNVTDRLVCKVKVLSHTGTVNLSYSVEDGVAAGIVVPLAPTNFVLKAGDTMTGTLNAPLFSGSFSGSHYGTSSWSNNSSTASSINFTPNLSNTASYVVTAQTASYITASNVDGTVGNSLTASYLTTTNNYTVNQLTASNVAVTSTTGQLRLAYNTSNYVQHTIDSGGGITYNATGSLPNYTFQRNNTSSLFISASGNIGVGTTTPSYTLEVKGNTSASAMTANNGYVNNLYMSGSLLTTYFASTAGYSGVDLKFNGGGVSRFLEVGVKGAVKDVFWQLFPGTTGDYGFLETWNGAGLWLSTGNNNSPIILGVNRTEVMRATSGSAGLSVGIGTTAPLTKLHVEGGLGTAVGIKNTAGVLWYLTSGTAGANASFGIGSSATAPEVCILGSGYATPGTRAGNVGIGTGAASTAITAKLFISGSVAAENLFRIDNASGSTALFVSSSGNIGIGTNIPVNKLDVVGNISCSYITASINAKGIIAGITTQTSNYALIATDYTVKFSGSFALSASLPSATTNMGIIYNIKNVSPFAVTVTGSQNIDNSNNGMIINQWSNLTIQSDGTQWIVL